ncbi:type I restriction enzyme HsdR N-terminal domain-containing protein [bacterium]|nr:type I restriction enzyme HsdR N-terminal domain-containing protein [bacterium]
MIDLKRQRVRVNRAGKTPVLKCLIRNRDIKATPEEKVRQCVLRYLTKIRRWSHAWITLEEGVRYIDGTRGRTDILLKDRDGTPALVIECKAGGILLGEDVRRQAIKYAQVQRAKSVWLTNGDDHRFFEKTAPGC